MVSDLKTFSYKRCKIVAQRKVCFFQRIFWYWCYYPHRSRDALSPVCRIFCVDFVGGGWYHRHWGLFRLILLRFIFIGLTFLASIVSLSKIQVGKTWFHQCGRNAGLIMRESLLCKCCLLLGGQHYHQRSSNPLRQVSIYCHPLQ